MNISPISCQTNFRGRFAQEYNTIKTLQAINDDPYCDRTDVKRNLAKLKSFYPDDVYTMNIKKHDMNGRSYDYLHIQNKRTKKDLSEGLYNNGGIAGAFYSLTSRILKMNDEKAVDFSTGQSDIVDLALADKNFDSPRYYGD